MGILGKQRLRKLWPFSDGSFLHKLQVKKKVSPPFQGKNPPSFIFKGVMTPRSLKLKGTGNSLTLLL